MGTFLVVWDEWEQRGVILLAKPFQLVRCFEWTKLMLLTEKYWIRLLEFHLFVNDKWFFKIQSMLSIIINYYKNSGCGYWIKTRQTLEIIIITKSFAHFTATSLALLPRRNILDLGFSINFDSRLISSRLPLWVFGFLRIFKKNTHQKSNWNSHQDLIHKNTL